jgi:hypothetical protein
MRNSTGQGRWSKSCSPCTSVLPWTQSKISVSAARILLFPTNKVLRCSLLGRMSHAVGEVGPWRLSQFNLDSLVDQAVDVRGGNL